MREFKFKCVETDLNNSESIIRGKKIISYKNMPFGFGSKNLPFSVPDNSNIREYKKIYFVKSKKLSFLTNQLKILKKCYKLLSNGHFFWFKQRIFLYSRWYIVLFHHGRKKKSFYHHIYNLITQAPTFYLLEASYFPVSIYGEKKVYVRNLVHLYNRNFYVYKKKKRHAHVSLQNARATRQFIICMREEQPINWRRYGG